MTEDLRAAVEAEISRRWRIVWALVALSAVAVPAVFVLGGAIFGLVVLAIAALSVVASVLRMTDIERQARNKVNDSVRNPRTETCAGSARSACVTPESRRRLCQPT